MGALAEFDRVVEAEYERELLKSGRKRGSTSQPSIKELDLTKASLRPSVSKFDLLESWRNLLRVLTMYETFFEYIKSLRSAFSNIDAIDENNYRHMKTLVDLLAHTAENKLRDESTECRFVTLLEVMLSYGPDWQPSEQVSRFWVRLMQRISADIDPSSFRRKAYRVLVSLSWVPSSKGLLGACSFEENKQMYAAADAPPTVRAQLNKIRNSPLPRYDCVNQLLDRLKDETDVCVAITSLREGTGKTTLAALVASHPSILRVFRVLWLSMKKEEVTYTWYRRILNDICEQIGVEMEWPECESRFEEAAMRHLREEGFMRQAQGRISAQLSKLDANILLIIDDIQDPKQLEWCRFNDRQSIIVTTPEPDLQGVDWTVELDPMSEDEAIDLFLREANFPESHIVASTREIHLIASRCGYHPLTIRTVARWYQMKQVTAGIVKAMEEILDDLEECSPASIEDAAVKIDINDTRIDDDADDIQESESLLYDVLSLMLGPSRIEGQNMSVLFVLCFAAMVVVFSDRAPLDAVLLLWEHLLRIEILAIEELGGESTKNAKAMAKKALFIAEALSHMGLVWIYDDSKGNPWIEIHHKEYTGFGEFMGRELDVADSYEDTVCAWHKAFVHIYFANRIQGNSDHVDDNSWMYAIKKLPYHMFKAKSYTMAETVLSDEHFFKARIEATGWNKAVDAHISDCIKLQIALDDEDNSTAGLLTGSPIFKKFTSMIIGEEGRFEASERDSMIASALYKISFSLAEIGYFEQALEYFEKSQELSSQSNFQRASIFYGLACTLLASGDHDTAFEKIKASRKLMDEMIESHVLFKEVLQLQAEVLVAKCAYREAIDLFEEVVDLLYLDKSNSMIELGTTLVKKGRLHHLMGETDKAVATLNESITCKTEIQEISKSLALAYSSLGDVYMERRQITDAREQYEKAILILDKMKYDPNNVDHLLSIGKLRFLRSEFSSSLKALESARESITLSPILVLDHSSYDLRSIARVYQARGDLKNAIQILNQCLELTHDKGFSLERAAALAELGNCLLDQDQFDDGLLCLEQSLEIRILKLGECNQVLETLDSIGHVHLTLGAYDQSLAIYSKLQEITERIEPENKDAIAGILYSIAEVYRSRGDYDECIFKLKDSIKVLTENANSNHPDVAKALHELGNVSVIRKDLDAAYTYFTEALRIRSMYFDENALAETQHCLGVLLRNRGDLEGSQEYLLEALDNRKSGDDSSLTAETLLEIGNNYRLQSETDSAMSVFEKAMEILETGDALQGSLYLCMGHIKFALGEDVDALRFYQRAQDVRLKAFGKDDMKTANTVRSVGLLFYFLERPDEAMLMLNDFVRVYEMTMEANHGEDSSKDSSDSVESLDYVLAIILLGDIYFIQGNPDKAKAIWAVAQEVCDENNGLEEQLNGLSEMVKRRFDKGQTTEESKRLVGRLQGVTRFADAKIIGLSAREIAMLRKFQFLDD